MYITEAEEAVFFPNTEKSVASGCMGGQCTHIVSYDRSVPAPLGCSRDVWACWKDFFAPTALLLTPQAAHGTVLSCPGTSICMLLTDCT